MEELIERTIACRTAIKGMPASACPDINDVILVGGMTRMPKGAGEGQGILRQGSRRDVNPDEAVAVGAAIQGQVLGGRPQGRAAAGRDPLSLGIETLGGVMTKMITKNTTIPTKFAQTFSTADDNQPAVTIQGLPGRARNGSGNKLLGEFNLEGIPPGSPRCSTDRSVVRHRRQRHLARGRRRTRRTGKENKITIKANSGLSKKKSSDGQGRRG